ncbi:hypothetical protein AB0B50_26215 [Streptomyces sp. NPDC041068]|uniref:hypothetical protein n=1 Tax=Streptomyces sp. NPDC041068 TaxID=3155130 RepID=UPI003405EDFC
MELMIKQIASGGASGSCSKVGGLGSVELVLLRQVFGLCLRLSVRISGDCPVGKGS